MSTVNNIVVNKKKQKEIFCMLSIGTLLEYVDVSLYVHMSNILYITFYMVFLYVLYKFYKIFISFLYIFAYMYMLYITPTAS